MENLKIGWLSPSGELVECCSYDHIAAAKEIADTRGMAAAWHPDDALMGAGWAYIGLSSFGTRELRIGWGKFLTDYQKNFLKPYFENEFIPVNGVAMMRWAEENGNL